MAVWLVRAGKYGEDENLALEKGWAVVGWHEMPDVSSVKSFDEMKSWHETYYPDMSSKAISNNTGQLWSFRSRIHLEDIIVLPLKTRSAIAIGKVTGEYRFVEGRHTRTVKWLRDDVPRSNVGQDLLYSLGAFMTVCEIKRNEAERRILSIMEGKHDPYLTIKASPSVAAATEHPLSDKETEWVDLEEQAYDQLRILIESRFKGHGLARLVEAVLQAKGYITHRSPEGPDGGVDILAGGGPMGFAEPRLCVQVKSGGAQNDTAIRELEGAMSRLHVESGLFVSWDGFIRTAIQNTRDLFFRVRLWDDNHLIKNLLETYERLPGEIQAELPLKRIWVVVPEEEG